MQEDREETLKKKLDEAQIVILLITPDYVSSAIYEQEYDLILKRSEKGAIVIPILLRTVSEDDWKEEFYGKFQALPRNRKAVDSRNDQDRILAEIATEIKKIVKYYLKRHKNAPSFKM